VLLSCVLSMAFVLLENEFMMNIQHCWPSGLLETCVEQVFALLGCEVCFIWLDSGGQQVLSQHEVDVPVDLCEVEFG